MIINLSWTVFVYTSNSIMQADYFFDHKGILQLKILLNIDQMFHVS